MLQDINNLKQQRHLQLNSKDKTLPHVQLYLKHYTRFISHQILFVTQGQGGILMQINKNINKIMCSEDKVSI